MEKKDLIDQGLTEEQAKYVMTEHGTAVTKLNAQVATAESERDSAKQELKDNQSELDTLKEAAKGNKELEQQFADLQAKFDESKANSEKQLADQQKDFAIQLALKEAGAQDEAIVLGLLDRDTIKVADGKLQGFEEQVKTLKEQKAFLFQDDSGNNDPDFVSSGNAGGPSKNSGTSMKQEMKSENFNLTEYLQKQQEGEK